MAYFGVMEIAAELLWEQGNLRESVVFHFVAEKEPEDWGRHRLCVPQTVIYKTLRLAMLHNPQMPVSCVS